MSKPEAKKIMAEGIKKMLCDDCAEPQSIVSIRVPKEETLMAEAKRPRNTRNYGRGNRRT